MMKRCLALPLAALLLTACAGNPPDSGQRVSAPDDPFADSQAASVPDDPFADSQAASAPDDPFADSQAASESDDPFAENDPDDGLPVRSFVHGVYWEPGREYVLEWAPTVSFRYYAELDGAVHDAGLLLFVNGFRQPYRTDESPENSTLHIFDVPQEARKELTVEFEPVIGETGETLSVEIAAMLHPRFALTEHTKDSELFVSHSIHSLLPSALTVTQGSGLTAPAVCTDYTAEPVTEELRREFDQMNSAGGYSGDNALDGTVCLDALKNGVLITPADRLRGTAETGPFGRDDSVTLCMYGGGKPCKYRVSAYLDHALLKGAFDGSDYIDMTPSRDVICKKSISLQGAAVSPGECHHLYFIAVPFYTEKDYSRHQPVKSTSAALLF